MDAYSLFLIFLAIYIAVMLGIGLYFSRSQRSVTDFWLAGRELGPLIIGFSAASSWTTASALLLATGLFLLIGVGSIWIWVLPNIAGLMIIAMISKIFEGITVLKSSLPRKWTRQQSLEAIIEGISSFGSLPVKTTWLSPSFFA